MKKDMDTVKEIKEILALQDPNEKGKGETWTFSNR
jgi:hypothetical protein